jgi:BMFP domain-containing protein YqiC
MYLGRSWEGAMADRPRFFDDLAGVAGGAMSALAGLREEAESMVRARVDEAIRKLDLVRREDMEAVQELAANARAAQQALEARVAALEAKLAASASGMPNESRPTPPSADGPQSAPSAAVPGSDEPGTLSRPEGAA